MKDMQIMGGWARMGHKVFSVADIQHMEVVEDVSLKGHVIIFYLRDGFTQIGMRPGAYSPPLTEEKRDALLFAIVQEIHKCA